MNARAQRGPLRQRKSLHEELIGEVRELILSGKLEAGKKVPEKVLCEMYGVSRTPLREALKVLATEGLVDLEANRGAWVSQVTLKDLDEVFPVMGALEALAGELACKHITDREIAHIRAMHEKMFAHFDAGELPSYFAVNERIHEAIMAAAQNETLVSQYRSLAARVRRVRYVADKSPESWARSTEDHQAIVESLAARDGARLSQVLKRHLAHAQETVREWLLSQRDQD